MNLVTWNCCRGTLAKKAPLLDALKPDIAVIQECAKPERESDTCVWFGDNPRQGIAVCARPPYRVHPMPPRKGIPKHIFPVSITGPTEFNLLAIWSKGNQDFPYIEGVVKAAEIYRDLILASPTVLIGDLNSNSIWDAKHHRDLNHSAFVRLVGGFGLVSAYHAFHGEDHGREKTPTYYFQWKEQRPFHIDYCFIPEIWAQNIRRVEIGKYEDWRKHSDHRPLLVEISQEVTDGNPS
jgi:hypothetical protein